MQVETLRSELSQALAKHTSSRCRSEDKSFTDDHRAVLFPVSCQRQRVEESNVLERNPAEPFRAGLRQCREELSAAVNPGEALVERIPCSGDFALRT